MDSMRRMNAYVKLNFQRCLSQGKTLVICICLAVFFYLYFGDVRGGLMESGQKIGIMEMFLVVTNNMYTSFTIWIGFVLIICDIPYRDDGVYQYLLLYFPKELALGTDRVYCRNYSDLFCIYIFITAASYCAAGNISDSVDDNLCKDDKCTVWLWNFQLFFIPSFGHAPDNGAAAVWQMHCSLPDDWNGNWFSDYDASYAVAEWSWYCNRWNRNCDGLLGNGCASRSDK